MRAYGVAALLTALLLAGCSSDDPDAEPSGSGLGRRPPAPTVVLEREARPTRPRSSTPTQDLLDWTQGARAGRPTPPPSPATGRSPSPRTATARTLRGPTQATVTAGQARARLRGTHRRRVRRRRGERRRSRSSPGEPPSSTWPRATRSCSTAAATSRRSTAAPGRWAAATCCTRRTDPAAPTAWRRSTWPPATSAITWCAPKRNGFSNARISPGGDSLMTFDDSQPSCRTRRLRRRRHGHRVPRRDPLQGLGRRAARGQPGVVGGPEGRPDRGRPPLRRGRRRLLRPRPGQVRHPRGLRTARRTSPATRSATATRPRSCAGPTTAR